MSQAFGRVRSFVRSSHFQQEIYLFSEDFDRISDFDLTSKESHFKLIDTTVCLAKPTTSSAVMRA